MPGHLSFPALTDGQNYSGGQFQSFLQSGQITKDAVESQPDAAGMADTDLILVDQTSALKKSTWINLLYSITNRDVTRAWVTDTGAANAYVVALPLAPGAYYAGMVIRMKAATANTGASTINVNSLGVKSIVRPDGTALTGQDIKASQVVTLVYDGTSFQLGTPNPSGVATKNNINSTTDPAVTDDTSGGYTITSLWINKTGKKVWVCMDATAGAAVWNLLFGNFSDLVEDASVSPAADYIPYYNAALAKNEKVKPRDLLTSTVNAGSVGTDQTIDLTSKAMSHSVVASQTGDVKWTFTNPRENQVVLLHITASSANRIVKFSDSTNYLVQYGEFTAGTGVTVPSGQTWIFGCIYLNSKWKINLGKQYQ